MKNIYFFQSLYLIKISSNIYNLAKSGNQLKIKPCFASHYLTDKMSKNLNEQDLEQDHTFEQDKTE